MGVLRLILGALVAVFVSSFGARAQAQFLSPGQLSKAHAELEGDERCGDCHSAGRRVANDKCMSCHQDVAGTVRRKTGLHGRTYAGQPCASCHVDHRGRSHDLVRWDQKTFDHRQAGWPLRDAHARLDCMKCHTNKNERGVHTFIGQSSACASCHEDPHKGRFGRECQSCHDEQRWKNVDLDPFDHDLARYPLRGKHKTVPCAKCHGEPPKYQPLKFDLCGDCHKDPHKGRLGTACETCHDEKSWKATGMSPAEHPGVSLSNGHARVACKDCHDRGNMVAPSRGERCVSCHQRVHEADFGDDCASCHTNVRWVGLPDALGRKVHARTEYPLEGAHKDAACVGCHSPKKPLAKRYRGLDFDECMDCHRDVHERQFADRQGGRCESCHTVAGFVPTMFGAFEHASTELPLLGAHEATPCGSCHTGKAPRLNWQLDKLACADCHENPHGSRFEREMREGGCGACHGTAAWDVLTIPHETWPLTGKHAAVRCDQCHAATEADQRAGNGPSYRTAPRECEGCHADVHLGQFRLKEPEKACGDCHDTNTFRLPKFDHAKSTGYVLDGKHAPLPCKDCHAETALENGQRTALWRLGYQACRDCHADPHVEGK